MLWVFATLNYLYADVFHLFYLVLKPRANRWANIVAGTLETAAVILTTIFIPTLYYLFFGTIEVACTSLIVWYAWNWPKETATPN